jgi:hypothetical protein
MYTGTISYNQRNGKGYMHYSGSIYVGEWKNDVFYCVGVFY